jgi:hypothetical protein
MEAETYLEKNYHDATARDALNTARIHLHQIRHTRLEK